MARRRGQAVIRTLTPSQTGAATSAANAADDHGIGRTLVDSRSWRPNTERTSVNA